METYFSNCLLDFRVRLRGKCMYRTHSCSSLNVQVPYSPCIAVTPYFSGNVFLSAWADPRRFVSLVKFLSHTNVATFHRPRRRHYIRLFHLGTTFRSLELLRHLCAVLVRERTRTIFGVRCEELLRLARELLFLGSYFGISRCR